MRRWARVFDLARVELRRFLRDRGNIFFVFVLPLGLVAFIGLQFGSGQGSHLGVVSDDGPAVTSLIEQLEETEDLRVTHVEDEDRLRSLVSRANLAGGIVIPSDYEDSLRTGAPVTIGFVSRPDPEARSLRQLVEAVVAEQTLAVEAARAASVVVDVPFADLLMASEQEAAEVVSVELAIEEVGGNRLAQEFAGLGQFDLGASSQLFLFVFLTSLTGSAAMIQTRTLGVATRMLSTPTPLPAIVAGIGGGRLAIALFQGVYIVLVTAVVFQVDWGDPLATGVLVLVFSLVSAATGMLLGSTLRNDSQAAGVGVGLGLVLAALGGSMVPLEIFPEGMRRVALFTPHGWANTAMAEIVRRDGGLTDVPTEIGVLAAMAVVVLALATWALRRTLTR